MKQIFALCVALTFLTQIVSGQEFVISQSFYSPSDEEYHILGKWDNKYVVLLYTNEKCKLLFYNGNMERVMELPFTLPGKEILIVDIHQTDPSSFSIIYTSYAKHKYQLNIARYDYRATLLQSALLTESLSDTESNKYVYLYNPTDLTFAYCQLHSGGELKVWTCNIESQTLLWNTSMLFDPYTLENELESIQFDKFGALYVFLDKNNKKQVQDTHQAKVITYQPATAIASEQNIPLQLLNVDARVIYDSAYHAFHWISLCHKDSRYKESHFMHLELPLTSLDSPIVTYHPIPKSFLEKNTEEDFLEDTEIAKTFFQKDGGLIIVFEKNKETQLSPYPPGPTSSTFYRNFKDYLYEDLLLLSLNPEEEIRWTQEIKKKQFSQDDDGSFSSFGTMVRSNQLLFFFNNNASAGLDISSFICRVDGTLQKLKVHSSVDSRIRPLCRYGVQVAARELLMPAFRGSKVLFILYICPDISP